MGIPSAAAHYFHEYEPDYLTGYNENIQLSCRVCHESESSPKHIARSGDGHFCSHHPDDPAHGKQCYNVDSFTGQPKTVAKCPRGAHQWQRQCGKCGRVDLQYDMEMDPASKLTEIQLKLDEAYWQDTFEDVVEDVKFLFELVKKGK